jgi:hypothetical protein
LRIERYREGETKLNISNVQRNEISITTSQAFGHACNPTYVDFIGRRNACTTFFLVSQERTGDTTA